MESPPCSGAEGGAAAAGALGLGLLRARGIIAPPSALGLELMGCYAAPWLISREDQDQDRELYPALRGLVGLHAVHREDAFPMGLSLSPLSPLSPLAPLGPLSSLSGSGRRPRGEKRPTPEDQKDQRYLERRRRNNRAAKKSRDARRAREDQIALRAALLEHENAVLRAQLLTLREETHSLRQLLLHAKESPLT